MWDVWFVMLILNIIMFGGLWLVAKGFKMMTEKLIDKFSDES